MILEKVERFSIPSEEITTKTDYYVIDAETVETLAYILEAYDVDAVSYTANEIVNGVLKDECK